MGRLRDRSGVEGMLGCPAGGGGATKAAGFFAGVSMTFRRLVAGGIAGLAIATAGVLALADPPRAGFAPDPPARASEKQWVFEIAFEKGAGTITSARSATAKKPIATARAMGRFALELRVGPELLDRIRFDVPLLGDEMERDPKHPSRRPKFDRVSTKVKVQMADHPRAAVLAFVDRSTGATRLYFWPPDEKGQLAPFSAKAATRGAADGGAGDGGGGDAGSSDASSSDAGSSDASATGPVSDAGDGGGQNAVSADSGADGAARDGG